MQMDQAGREGSEAKKGSGRSAGTGRNVEPKPSEQAKSEQNRTPQDDLILHDDDEAELELPR